ncbi:hypothetical protein P0082_04135 [Candidatus Haliotispira prima]|uniref:TRAM domain-containing protein n=1 Tax=Candidatus Haliotispira prima TaxID=3034016 RepID=A0ABY8MJB8_9SPIO|nr:hypothetical protein P0082_04135 [Candidatus Haliotispira prima]
MFDEKAEPQSASADGWTNGVEAVGTVEKLISGGAGLLRHQSLGVCFVPHVLPGELVRFRVVGSAGLKLCNEKQDESNPRGFFRGFSRAELLEVLRPSPLRVRPRCEHYDVCGGCDWQHVGYRTQIELKSEIVLENLQRLAGGKDYRALMRPAIAESDCGAGEDSPGWGYRHRAKFFRLDREDSTPENIVSNGFRRLGFRRRESRESVGVPRCQILDPKILRILRDAEDSPSFGDEGRDEELHVFAGEQTCHWGAEEFDYRWNGLMLRSRARLFFQSNAKVLPLLLAELQKSLAPILSGWQGSFVDLYAGVGLFSGCLAPLLPDPGCGENPRQKYFAVERSSEAFHYLKQNLTGKGFRCCQEEVGTFLKKTLQRSRSALQGSFIFADPSRGGLSTAVRRHLNSCGAEYIVYLSCDAASFARDIGHLTQSYRVEYWRLIDFYPQTHHIETLALLKNLRK